ncbi:hypothetical protein [Cellulomonas humilata]|uniref:Uncharacterized protein n=1 Tax=Cellulomonas humilata TaxID=144055 RepID=A0ABU0EL00_9CELL|nr:hypothetical protein [Cellulomonas humilata]MDQ0375976.1 hypothetical protein [Cellulomonas humilata]
MSQPLPDPFPVVRPPRQLKPSPLGGSASRFPSLVEPRQRLDQLRVDHLTITARALEVADGKVFLPDLIVTAMLQRSYGVVDALIDAVDTYNVHAAAPLLRLQLDTLFRAHYIASGPDLDDLTSRLQRGEEFRKIRDSEGKYLTDGRLQALAREVHGWATPVYRETSGWVHFSVSHMRTTTQGGDDDAFFMGVPVDPSVIRASLWQEIYAASTRATEELFEYVRGWAARKGMPPGEVRRLSW